MTVNTGSIASYVSYAPDSVLTNYGTILASSASAAVHMAGAGATVANYGYVAGQTGVLLSGGGVVANGLDGMIAGYFYGVATGSNGTAVVNAGTILSHRLDAIVASGGVINTATGTIQASAVEGIAVRSMGSMSVTNAGLIYGGSAAIEISAGDNVVNSAGGTIAAYDWGIDVTQGAITIRNAGTIAAHNIAVALDGSAAGRIIVYPGASFSGLVDGGTVSSGYGASTLEFAAGTTAGTIAGLGSRYVHFGNVIVDAGAAWTVASANTLGSGIVLTNNGMLFDTGVLSAPTLLGSGEVSIAPGAALRVAGSIAPVQTIAFAGANGLLAMPASDATIGQFQVSDTIDLAGFVATGDSFAGNRLTLTNASAGTVTLDLEGDFTGYTFALTADSGSGTDIALACFAAGTRIRAQPDDIAVENLRAGDMVYAPRLNDYRPVRWIGHRSIDLARHPCPERARPVRIAAGTFAPGVPSRDLLLSPDHAIFAAGVLIPIRLLVDGDRIAPVPVRRIMYFHVELPTHDILLAEGLPTESYLDTGNRASFANGGHIAALFPPFATPAADIWEGRGCAPLVVHGPELDAIRAVLLSRKRRAA